jgi:hypothetical protein
MRSFDRIKTNGHSSFNTRRNRKKHIKPKHMFAYCSLMLSIAIRCSYFAVCVKKSYISLSLFNHIHRLFLKSRFLCLQLDIFVIFIHFLIILVLTYISENILYLIKKKYNMDGSAASRSVTSTRVKHYNITYLYEIMLLLALGSCCSVLFFPSLFISL